MPSRFQITLMFFFNYLMLVSSLRFIRPSNTIITEASSKQLIGVPDEHNCITGAGYSYCNYTDSCHHYDNPCFFTPPSSNNQNNRLINHSEY